MSSPPFKYSRRQFRGGDIDVRPDKAGASSRKNRPTMTKAESHVAWTAGTRVIEYLKPADKAAARAVSKPPGRNESERSCSPETPASGSRAFRTSAKKALFFTNGKCALQFLRYDSDIYPAPDAEPEWGVWQKACLLPSHHRYASRWAGAKRFALWKPNHQLSFSCPQTETPDNIEPIALSRAQIAEPEACPGSKRFALRSKWWRRVTRSGSRHHVETTVHLYLRITISTPTICIITSQITIILLCHQTASRMAG